MQRSLQRKLLGRNTARNAWLHMLDERLPRLEAPTTAAAWARHARQTRADLLDLFFQGHPRELLQEPPRVEWRGTIAGGEGYRIRKLRYEGYPGLWVPALLYEPTSLRGKVPAVLNPNGHHAGGKAMDYKQARCINLAKRGMLALNTEFIGMGELRADVEHLRIALLDLCGMAWHRRVLPADEARPRRPAGPSPRRSATHFADLQSSRRLLLPDETHPRVHLPPGAQGL
jgi:hypothetical protein